MEHILPTSEIDAIREIVIIAIGLLFRFLEKRKLKKQVPNE
jgi:hypothetical protein